MTDAPQEHRWVVDGIEEGIARIEEDGERVLTVPLTLLPAGVREGQVLKVLRAAGSSAPTITVDEAATTDAMKKSRLQVDAISKESKKRDPGGNVAL